MNSIHCEKEVSLMTDLQVWLKVQHIGLPSLLRLSARAVPVECERAVFG